MKLRSQDILVLLKIALWGDRWTFDLVAHELDMSTSAVHRSLDRAAQAGLYSSARREVVGPALMELVRGGIRFMLPPVWDGEARGVATAWAAQPLAEELSQSGKNPPVWPDSRGDRRGIALSPIDPRVPAAARRDEKLKELLTLVDAIRIGGARERDLAAKHLETRLIGPGG